MVLCNVYAVYIKIMNNENQTIHKFDFNLNWYGWNDKLSQLKQESLYSTNEMKAVFDDTFIEKLGEQKHVTDRIRVVEEYLLAYLARHYQPADSHVAMAVNMINHSKGKRSVRSLMDDVCLCQRHFERKFKHYTGFTPKEYSRIVKFKNAVELLRTTTSANLLTTAVDAGYYDLAHFSKEIKSMSGNTPASFLSLTVPEETTLTYIEPQR